MRVLVTGSDGLVGSALAPALVRAGMDVVPFDLVRGDDIRDPASLAKIGPFDGVVALAAVSRVVWGQRDPATCIATNVGGTRNILDAARRHGAWVVFASSREVYGQPDHLPVAEDHPLRPLNVYAETKVAGEALVRAADLRTAIVRLSSVYGSPHDHADRVVPAFCRAALANRPLRVEGRDHRFDLVWLDDVVDALSIISRRVKEQSLPDLHLVSGKGSTLGELAGMAIAAAGGGVAVDGPPRDYDVSAFVGDPRRARQLLGWSATTPVDVGVRRLVAALRG